jgi:PmbA protein
VVVQGVLTGYLCDRYWANRENLSSSGSRVESTANSRRHGIKFPPGVGISNFFIEPGDLDLPKLMGDLFQGVVVEDVMGLHTVDPISGLLLGCSGAGSSERKSSVKSIAMAELFDSSET